MIFIDFNCFMVSFSPSLWSSSFVKHQLLAAIFFIRLCLFFLVKSLLVSSIRVAVWQLMSNISINGLPWVVFLFFLHLFIRSLPISFGLFYSFYYALIYSSFVVYWKSSGGYKCFNWFIANRNLVLIGMYATTQQTVLI